jgi:trk system potassium uptake protein TrkA
MNIVILGCGRVGAQVAQALSGRHAVCVVDWDDNAFERLERDFSGSTFRGNGIDVDVLREAGTPDADVFFALTDGDNRNLMAAQLASHLGARKVVARVYDPVRCDAFSRMGVTTVSPTVEGARRLFNMVVAERKES